MTHQPLPGAPNPGWFRRLPPRHKAAVIAASAVAALLFIAVLFPVFGRGRSTARQVSMPATRPAANYGEPDERYGPGAAEADRSAPGAQYASLETWGRKLILSAAIALEVKDVRAAYDRVQLVAAREGALITNASLKAASDPEDDGGGYGHATLVLRVPQSRFHAVRQRLLGLAGDLKGKVLSDEVSSEDVTEEYVDLEARLRHWRAQEAQLLETMGKARQIKDILSVRDQLAKVQEEIERLTGRLRFLGNRVDLSVITLEIHQKGQAPAEPTLIGNWKKAGKAIAGAFKKALVDVVLVLGWIGVVITYLLPFALIIALVWAALRAARRRAPSRAPGA